MKRTLITAIITTTVTASILTGCGSSNNNTKEIVASESATESSSTADAVASESETASMTESQEETSSEDAGNTTSESAGDTTIEEQVIFDINDVKITAVEYVTDSIWGDGVKLLIENNGSSNVGVGCDALIVNDYMITDLFSEQVAAGKKSNETMDLLTSELEAAGIDNVGKIEFQLHLFDPETYMTTYTSDMITIQTNHYEDMDTTPNDDGQELYNNVGVRIVGKYVDEDSIWGNGIVLYLENNTDQNIIVQADDMSVNGFMMTPYLSSTIYANKKAIDDITLMQSELDENGIDSVEDVELVFHIVNADTYKTITDSDIISFSAK